MLPFCRWTCPTRPTREITSKLYYIFILNNFHCISGVLWRNRLPLLKLTLWSNVQSIHLHLKLLYERNVTCLVQFPLKYIYKTSKTLWQKWTEDYTLACLRGPLRWPWQRLTSLLVSAGRAQPKHSYTYNILPQNGPYFSPILHVCFSLYDNTWSFLSSYAPCEPYLSLRHAGLQQCKQSALFNRLESDWIYAHTQQPDAPRFMLLCDGPGILNDVIRRAVTPYQRAPFLKQTVVHL